MRDPSVTIKREPQAFQWIAICLGGLLLIPVLCVIGELAGFLISGFTDKLLDRAYPHGLEIGMYLIGGFISGLLVSVLTWSWMPAGGRDIARTWFVVTTLGVLLGSFVVGYLSSHKMTINDFYHFTDDSLALVAAVCGGLVGLSQLLMLKNKPIVAWLWLPASALDWWLTTQFVTIIAGFD